MASDSTVLLRHRPFLVYFLARAASEFSFQISAVAVGWQVYDLTDSAFALGMIGLVQFIPTAALTFIAGHVADRYDRKRVVQLCQIAEGLAALFLAWGSFAGWITVGEIYAAIMVVGIAIAFESPAGAALLPAVTPEGLLQKSSALSTGVFQLAMISGPAFGGFLYAFGPAVPYLTMAICWLLSALLLGAIAIARPPRSAAAATLATVFAGVAFVRANPAILGTISLDLFAVLLGGATALLPIYARDILHTDPVGLGVLRAAPAIGALLVTAIMTRYTIERRVGMRMFQSVMVFGLGIVVFGLSQSMWLSVLALAIMGAADTVSMVVRISLVQLATPDEMRGRVSAVNYLFVNASNQLGEFESGMVASLIGAMPAVVLGGLGTIVVVLLWMRLFPALRDVERLE